MKLLLAMSLLLLMTETALIGQSAQPAKAPPEGVEDMPVPNDLFPGFENAALIVDFYFSSGVSLSDRYSYEIIVTDRTLQVSFDSPGTDSYKRVTFNRKRALTADEARDLSRAISAARLMQVREGIPRPRYSGHTREVLIVRSKEVQIAGGTCSRNIFENSRSAREIEEIIQADRVDCSSIGGDYDAVIRAVRSLFPELQRLISEAEGAL